MVVKNECGLVMKRPFAIIDADSIHVPCDGLHWVDTFVCIHDVLEVRRRRRRVRNVDECFSGGCFECFHVLFLFLVLFLIAVMYMHTTVAAGAATPCVYFILPDTGLTK